MQIGTAPHQYTWIEDWAKIPDTPSTRNNGRTHGVEVLPDGRVAVFCQGVPGVLFFDADGSLESTWGDRFVGAHGMTLSTHEGSPAFWLVDQGSCEVVKTTLDGETLLRLDDPPADERPNGKYTPTWADQHPTNGDVWVGDGYGGSALYRFAADGTYQQKFTEFDGLPLDSPHGVRFAPDGRLWVTDRANHRIVILDGDGKLLDQSTAACHSPCSFAFLGDHAYVAELYGGAKVLDSKLNVLADLAQNPWLAPPDDWRERPKWVWPGEAAAEGYPNVAGTEHLKPGLFNAPHGIAVSPTGDIYVTEWIVGGRIIKLAKA
ncbi:MAG: hypothetical protein AAGI68_11125 [Planctomycetota bacterium]